MLAGLEPLFPDHPSLPLLGEMMHRLDRLSVILAWINDLEKQTAADGAVFQKAGRGVDIEATARWGRRFSDGLIKAEILNESFYVFSFRVIDISRAVSQNLFKKKPLVSEPSGIINVRNHLIIHPERSRSAVLSLSFSLSEELGGVLKSRRESHETDAEPDAGLWANAREFSDWMMNWTVAAEARLLGKG